MTTLNLSPLPSSRLDSAKYSRVVEPDGFVDDTVILSLLRGAVAYRDVANAADLALSADEMDFAGWSLSSRLPSHATEVPIKRAAPPVLEESGIGQPHAGAHRWWLAGVAGVFSTLLVSLLLLSLGTRNTREKDEFTVIKSPHKEQHSTGISEETSDRTPELTGTPAEH